MGTRHLIAVVKDGEYKIAQYGQWDGYPSGQGADILKFLRDTESVEKLREHVGAVRQATQDELDAIDEQAGIERGSEWITMAQSEARKAIAPQFSRDTGAKILDLVAAGGVEIVNLGVEFAQESLFCEYVYVIDLDANTFEAYIGFQTEPHELGRFVRSKPSDWTPDYPGQDFYYPVALQASYPLDALPTQETFEDDMLTDEERKERAEEEGAE